jgi:hypothetical protein
MFCFISKGSLTQTKALDAVNLATSGGRAATVGAGGLVIGGGNSFYAARKGLVCDNVAQFEVSKLAHNKWLN